MPVIIGVESEISGSAISGVYFHEFYREWNMALSGRHAPSLAFIEGGNQFISRPAYRYQMVPCPNYGNGSVVMPGPGVDITEAFRECMDLPLHGPVVSFENSMSCSMYRPSTGEFVLIPSALALVHVSNCQCGRIKPKHLDRCLQCTVPTSCGLCEGEFLYCETTEHGNHRYCQTCRDRSFTCHGCGERVVNLGEGAESFYRITDDGYLRYSPPGPTAIGRCICSTCRYENDSAVTCSNCDALFWADFGESLCPSCSENNDDEGDEERHYPITHRVGWELVSRSGVLVAACPGRESDSLQLVIPAGTESVEGKIKAIEMIFDDINEHDPRCDIVDGKLIIGPHPNGEWMRYRYWTAYGHDGGGCKLQRWTVHEGWETLELASIGLDVTSAWETTREGKPMKRLADAIFKHLGYKVPRNILSSAGEAWKRYGHSRSEMQLEYTFSRQWNETDSYYYNSGSCWWESYSSGREAFGRKTAFGIRIFSADSTNRNSDLGEGDLSGRVWMVGLRFRFNDGGGEISCESPDMRKTVGADVDAWLLYNHYGDGKKYLDQIARDIATRIGMKVRYVDKLYVSHGYTNDGPYALLFNDGDDRFSSASEINVRM